MNQHPPANDWPGAPRYQFWAAICLTCNWRGDWRRVEDHAKADGNEHTICLDAMGINNDCAVVATRRLAQDCELV